MTEFPRTRAAFKAALGAQGHGGASFSVVIDGHEALSLWGGEASPGTPWSATTRTALMSVTKGLAGLVVGLLIDKGVLDIEAPVREYWPEFATNGKAQTTVRMVLLHTAGALGVADPAKLLGADWTGWRDLDRIATALAESSPAWAPGSRHGYHAVTYGWLVGELVRRVEGRSLGAVLRHDVCEPLGLRTAIGLHPGEVDDVAQLNQREPGSWPTVTTILTKRLQRLSRDPTTLPGQAALGTGTASVFDLPPNFFSTPTWLTAEVPSSNGVSSAGDLARLWAVFCDGTAAGSRLVSERTLRLLSKPEPPRVDVVAAAAVGSVVASCLSRKLSIRRTVAATANDLRTGRFGPSALAIGAEGAGGQWVFADPERNLAVAFLRSEFGLDESHRRRITQAIYEDLEAA